MDNFEHLNRGKLGTIELEEDGRLLLISISYRIFLFRIREYMAMVFMPYLSRVRRKVLNRDKKNLLSAK